MRRLARRLFTLNAALLNGTGERLLLCTRPIFLGRPSRATGMWDAATGLRLVTIPTAANSHVGAWGVDGKWVALGHPAKTDAGGDTSL